MERESPHPVPEAQVGACAVTSLTLVYSAPTPGQGSRYVDGPVAHEVRVLWALPVRDALVGSDRAGVGASVLQAALACNALTGAADPRTVAYLAPLARAALLGRNSGSVLAGLGHDEIQAFVRALEVADAGDPLSGTLRMALGAGREATLRDAMRFADPAAPEKGLVFDGRVAEDFKLSTGTWVHVGAVRVKLIAACDPLVQDAVITGHDREEIGLLLFPTPQAKAVNWPRVEALLPYGGVRIEDEVHCTESAPENLTRDAFAAA